jgi:integrase
MALVNVRKEMISKLGQVTWRLIAPDGHPIALFTAFAESLKGAYSTKKRYTTVVARFLDFLYEMGLLGGAAVTRDELNRAIEYYLALLRAGPELGLDDEPKSIADDPILDANLRTVAIKLGIRSLASSSWDNTLSALNSFLTLCIKKESEAREIALLRGGISEQIIRQAEWDQRGLWDALEGNVKLSIREINQIKQTSMLGGVIRFNGQHLTRPSHLRKSTRQRTQMDVESLDFPTEQFPALIAACHSWRDKALWTLIMGCGIRRSEALNMRWCDIDFAAEKVFVFDPGNAVYGRELAARNRPLRFKGRTVAMTYFRQPYRIQFFRLLLLYRQHEYSLPADGNDFVFQYLRNPHRGRPLHGASDESLNKLFKSAVVRAGIPGPAVNPLWTWTCHSLRHAYGCYMLNDAPVKGQALPGLSLEEVQLLMGHGSAETTKKYAKRKTSKLRRKLECIDVEFVEQSALVSELQSEVVEMSEVGETSCL